ncbi:P-loop containing nucleoside triphosphate hydrolase protein [Schizopora paradoxa]|uniref:p-loop containing nucleoside triphosphate hydrolase protein n=1 Tax=Schizopora paradoxa TaxID=27342 RepID=A0A0H2RA87_9AGAM|nr:P-loop containing nucleoside triphosphate hydrolase protein [Schizopora paradoxa]
MAFLKTFSTILTFLWDLGTLAYALLYGKLRLSELWKQVVGAKASAITGDVIRSPPSGETVVGVKPLPPPTRLVRNPPESDTDIFSKHNCAVSGLCRAIVQRNVELVNTICQAAPFLASTKHSLGFYPLVAAVLSGEPEIVHFLLTQPGVRVDTSGDRDDSNDSSSDGSDDDDSDDDDSFELRKFLRSEFSSNPSHRIVPGASTLHYACMSNNPAVVWAICQSSVDFHRKDSRGKFPVDYIDSSSSDGLEVLRAYGAAYEDWQKKRKTFSGIALRTAAEAIFRKDPELFKSIINRSPNILEEHDITGWTLLHVAAMNEFMYFVEYIVTKSPTIVNARGKGFQTCQQYVSPTYTRISSIDGATALHIACLYGNFNMIELLLKAGADWTIADELGLTPEYYMLTGPGETQAIKFKGMCDDEERKRKGPPAPENTIGKPWGGSETPDGVKTPVDTVVGTGEMKVDEPKLPPPRDVEKIISSKIVGQRGAVHSVASAIRMRENGWSDPYRPLVMLFLGSSGVGKTELAKQLALYSHGKSDLPANTEVTLADMETDCNFIRIDMSDYQQSFTSSNLIGSPKGYVGYDEGGILTRSLEKNPNAVVLLDEIERAHPDILTAFLQVFDEGRITDSKHGVIYCENATFIMTSNLASEEIKKAAPLLRQMANRIEEQPGQYARVAGNFIRRIQPVLKGAFKRDEFVGRINETVIFLPLSKEEVGAIIIKELKAWKKRAEENHNIHISWSSEVVDKITKSYNVNFGARSVINEVTRTAVMQIAEAQIKGILEKNSLAYLTMSEAGNIELRTERREGYRVLERRGCRFHLY